MEPHTDRGNIMKRTRKPSHPGEAFWDLVIKPQCLSINLVARSMKVNANDLADILDGNKNLSKEMADKFGEYTNTSAGSWLNMQTDLDEWEKDNEIN